MKKLLIGLFSLCLFLTTTQAQVDTPEQALKSAKKLLSSYNTAPSDNADKLEQAKEKIDFAVADEAVGNTYKAQMMKAKIYTELAGKDVTDFTLAQVAGNDAAFVPMNPTAGITAFNAYKMAMEKANPKKKFEKKDALKGIQEAAVHLSTIGNMQTSKKDYGNAYNSLNTILEMREVLNENGIETLITDEADLNNHKYVTAYCAMISDRDDAAKALFMDLKENNYHEDGAVHAMLFNLMKDEDEAAAMKVLKEGATAYPANKEILFAKINYYIQKEDYKTLKGELEKAVEAAPDNPSVFAALGNVYMNLFQDEFAAGNVSVSEEYFKQAKGYYEDALALDENLFDVQYSIGSLYYNKAVEVTKIMNDLPISENKKYDALNKEAKGFFEEGLPYFKKAESMNPSDLNTLIALKEIYARLDDFTMSNEFKDRIGEVQAGKTIEKSYF